MHLLLLAHFLLHLDRLRVEKRLVGLHHGLIRVRDRGVLVLLLDHQSLSRGRWSSRTVLKKLCIWISSLDHVVFFHLLAVFEVLIDGLLGEFFCCIRHFAKVRAPGAEAEGDDEVEDDDLCCEPPVEQRHLAHAVVVLTSPEDVLDEVHHDADESIETKESLRVLLQTLRQSDHLKEK